MICWTHNGVATGAEKYPLEESRTIDNTRTHDLRRVDCVYCLKTARDWANLSADAPIEAVIDKLIEEGKL